MAGDQRRAPGWRMSARYTADYLLLIVFDGQEWLETEGGFHEIAAGQGYLIQPGQAFSKGADRASHCCWIAFDLARDSLSEQRPPNHRTLEQWAKMGGLEAWLQPTSQAVLGGPLPELLDAEFAPRFCALAPRLVEWMRSPLPPRQDQANLSLGALLAEYASRLLEDRGTSESVAERIARAEEIALRSLDTGFNVTAFAAAAGMQLSWFHECYRKLRNRPPKAYLLDLRMQQAREYLSDPSLSIKSVSRLTGYADATAFGRAFRREHGCSPQAWREKRLSEADPS